jgi:hypothetical protein
VHVCNRADLDTVTLSRAETEASLLLRSSHIQSDWRASCAPDPSRSRDDLTQISTAPLPIQALGSPVLHVRLVRGGPLSAKAKYVLGRASRLSDGGLQARIFVDRVRALSDAQANGTKDGRPGRFEILLGQVLAHELGHLLLPSLEHSSQGLMHANWSDVDLRQVTDARLRFTEEEGQRMRENLWRWQHR